MYITMARKQRNAGALILCLLILAGPVSGLEKTIELGKANLWSDILTMEGVTAVPGRWGFHDLVLASGQYTPDSSTELLLHFDGPATADAGGAYTLGGAAPIISQTVAALGGASAAFTGKKQGVTLTPPPEGMFAPGGRLERFHHRVLALSRHALRRGERPLVDGLFPRRDWPGCEADRADPAVFFP